MAETPDKAKKCANCGAPAEFTFVDVEDGKSVGEKALCRECAGGEKFGWGWKPTSTDMLQVLVSAMEGAIESREKLASVHAHLKKLTGKDLPAEPAPWKQWVKEHPEEVNVSQEQFRQAAAELGIRTAEDLEKFGVKGAPERTPIERVEFFIGRLEEGLASEEDLSCLLTHLKKLTGKDLPAEPATWRQWMKEHPEEIKFDKEEFLQVVTELGMKFMFATAEGMKEVSARDFFSGRKLT